MTETQTKSVKLDKTFEPLPDVIKTQLSTLPEHLNTRDQQGNHLSPRMGRLVRAFRQANGNLSQKALAEQQFKDKGLMTTHCQIATLEQGGCKKGANPDTIKLLAHGLGVKAEVIEAINKADLEQRAARGDEQAKKVLGIADTENETPAKKDGDATVKPAEAAKKTTAPAPKPAPVKDKVSM